MSCNTALNGRSKCSNVYGGVVQMWIAPKSDISGTTISTGELTAATLSTNAKEYAFREGQAFANSEAGIDFATGTTVFNNNITINLKDLDLDLRNELMILTKYQQELVVFYLTDTGVYWAIGLTNGDEGKKIGARVTTLSTATGTRRADANEAILNIGVDNDKELPITVDETLAGTILDPAS